MAMASNGDSECGEHALPCPERGGHTGEPGEREHNALAPVATLGRHQQRPCHRHERDLAELDTEVEPGKRERSSLLRQPKRGEGASEPQSVQRAERGRRRPWGSTRPGCS